MIALAKDQVYAAIRSIKIARILGAIVVMIAPMDGIRSSITIVLKGDLNSADKIIVAKKMSLRALEE